MIPMDPPGSVHDPRKLVEDLHLQLRILGTAGIYSFANLGQWPVAELTLVSQLTMTSSTDHSQLTD